MTEKRFYVAESHLTDGYCTFDQERKYAFTPRPRRADCLNDAHILNEFHEKNEQLKKENKELKEDYDKIFECYNKNFNEKIKLKKENKELKEKLNDILELTELSGMIHLRKAEIKSIIDR